METAGTIPWIELDNIDNESTFPGGIAKKEVIRLFSQKASQISQEHSIYRYLTLIIALSQPSIGFSQ